MSTTAEQWRAKRRRRQHSSDDEEDPFKDFDLKPSSTGMTAAKRLRLEREQALQTMAEEVQDDAAGARMRAALSRRALASVGENKPKLPVEAKKEEQHDDDKSDEETNQDAKEKTEDNTGNALSLLEQAARLKKQHESLNERERSNLQRQQDEARILKEASHVQTNALQAASELAEGVKYKSTFVTAWRCPAKILREAKEWEGIRKKWHILTEGEDIPPPIRNFRDMAFPPPILEALQKKNVKRPTPIQMQGLTVALSGRDMVGIAFTGSGKTLSFSLPLVMAAMEEEARMPLVPGEGPVGIVLAPSRELARQTYEVVMEFCDAIANYGDARYPNIRSQLLIGGESGRDQLQPFRDRGVHCVVATPGRLRDFLKKRSINLDICRYICLDEADRYVLCFCLLQFCCLGSVLTMSFVHISNAL
jgi:ATP-dependent RNA helicase DDX41